MEIVVTAYCGHCGTNYKSSLIYDEEEEGHLDFVCPRCSCHVRIESYVASLAPAEES